MIFASISGNLGKDAAMRDTKGGPMCTFGVASESRRGQEKTTTWVNCALFGKRGEALCKHLTKGSRITVHGKLTMREYQGKQTLDVEVSEVVLLGGGQRQSAPADTAPAAQQSSGGGYSDADYGSKPVDDENFPF